VPAWLVSAYSNRDYNVDAAFPSLHSAFPLIAAAHAWARDRRVGLALAGWTLAVWLSVVYLGEHYVVDIAGGVTYAVAGLLAVAWWRRRRTRRTVGALAVEPV
jgi:membrane-associated phospholipid phosphatase